MKLSSSILALLLVATAGGGIARAERPDVRSRESVAGRPAGIDDGAGRPTNIGFMRPVPPDLAERYPMCDEFLDVEWIDLKNRIGKNTHELYLPGEPRAVVTTLVHLREFNPTYALEEFSTLLLNKGRETKSIAYNLAEALLPIQRGHSNGLSNESKFSINGTTTSYSGVSPKGSSLAENRLNICVQYPDQGRVWLAEYRYGKSIYSKKEIERKNSQLRAAVRNIEPVYAEFLERDVIGNAWVVDLNRDGIEDYVNDVLGVMYSFRGGYYTIRIGWVREIDDEYGRWLFPPTENVCEFNMPSSLDEFITSDGTNFYLWGKCNITQLTVP